MSKKILLLTLIIYTGTNCLEVEKNIGKSGVYEFKLEMTNENIVRCNIEVASFLKGMLYNRRWGSDWENPKVIISSIKLWINKKEIFIPLSAYSDISNVRLAKLLTISGGYRIIIQGGDAATSYELSIDIYGNRVSRRKIRSSEFPDEGWEMTIYSNEEIKDTDK